MDLTAHTSLSPIQRGFGPGFVNYKKGWTRLAAASDQVYQLLAHGRWFSPGTPASSTTKTGRHDIAEILLKVALKHQKSNQSLNVCLITNSINFVWSLTTNQILSHLFSVPKHYQLWDKSFKSSGLYFFYLSVKWTDDFTLN
jgi:hypothetical protein